MTKPGKKATKRLPPRPPVIDPYLPQNGNYGYRVSRYELDLEYKVAINRLTGTANITAVTLATIKEFTLDLADTLGVSKVTVNGRRPTHFGHRAGKITIKLASAIPAGAAMTIVIRYGGSPRPINSMWGDVGFEELSNGVLVAGQPNGAASWFPCDDHPSSKASYRFVITSDSPYCVISNGELISRRVRAAHTTWTYEQPEPMAPYLATLQIGDYQLVKLAKNPVSMNAALPSRLRDRFEHDFGRQPQMMKLFIKQFGPYPFAAGYTVVVTDDDLDIPLEAQGISVFGANHCDGSRHSERLVAHELAHQWFGNSVTARRWRDIWLHEGFACYAEWLWSEESGGPTADARARHYHQKLKDLPQELILADPGPQLMFDDRVYKRGALTLHALRLRLGDTKFFALLQDWTTRYRHSTVITDDFTGLAAGYSDESLRPLWTAWLYEKQLPPLDRK
ncbi:M1 family metallopeptidase [Mycobacteroides abscessus]|uniref:M1 family metallopeptidase n=1 Tax=Mycobacteroides abscessus TaxID=36809 RepID=UPI0009A7EAFC|nr:M1 family metallopeptidase [Mycobacteroides abscessus]SKG72597.1 peptidase M1, membrane alanine aminopeptidase [Mycobacteroides abscessus subsp. bolletii]SKK66850.1 Probable peptidase M1, membrane alanine aminopeptidase [Mycobacteroides abscessus subsp. bolletii]SLF41491.1 Probable peptidase M1, membrane alanine aminopeptidase [Mycobacteroides abscessus subsp. bolletii]SPX80622.1 peptidase M1, membrane alanine aminopeptidase [Mycobacteroides abscessus]